MQTKKTFMQRLLQKNRDLVSENETLKRRIGELSESYQGQIKSLQSLIDEANAQEPYRYIGNGKTLAYPNPVYENDAEWVPVYLHPIPAQQSKDNKELKFYGNVNLSEAISMAEQQSPAVAVPDYDLMEFHALGRLEDSCAKSETSYSTNEANESILLKEAMEEMVFLQNDRLHKNRLAEPIGRVCRLITKIESALANRPINNSISAPPRITEQEARGAVMAFTTWRNGWRDIAKEECDQFFDSEYGRALLNKLNGDQNGK